MFVLPLIPVIAIFFYNCWMLFTYKKSDFTLQGYFRREEAYTPAKKKAMYSAVDLRYLSIDPNGFILGGYKGKYVRIPNDPNHVLHTCIIGTPGSGKSSSLLINTLLANYMHPVPPTAMFVIDIKPELAYKSVELDQYPFVRIVNPTDQNSYGWDVYYKLDPYSTDDEVTDTLTILAESLITGDRTSPRFFIETARTLFLGIMLYYYRCGISFVDAVHQILKKDVAEHIAEILNDPENCPEDGMAYAILNPYRNIEGDAFDNIRMYLQGPLRVFLRSDVRYMFRDNLKKASPGDLERGISVFLSFPEALLKNYKGIFNLIVSQTLDHLQNRRESASQIIHVIIDEFTRLGRLDILLSLGTLRSRKVAITVAMQDLSQAVTVYSPEECRTLLNLCEVICILSTHDPETCRMISDWAGTYQEQVASYSYSTGHLDGRTNISLREKRVLDPKDIMSLREEKELIAVIEGQYFRFNKIFYMDDPVLGERYRKVAEANDKKLL